MGTITVSNFSGGMDRTRPIYALENGRLWQGDNGHISRGGDFEKRKKFQSLGVNTTNTFGLSSDGVSNLYVYGSAAAPVGFPYYFTVTGIPGSLAVNYVRLQNGGANMYKVLRAEWFAGKQYVVASFSDGKTIHFYDGVIVSDWSPGGASRPTSTDQIGDALTYKRKMYASIGPILYFSSYDFPASWLYVAPPNPGAGFLNMANNLRGNEQVNALAIYKDQLAVFSTNAIQLWSMNNDPALNAPGQIITGSGTVARKSVVGYGDHDVIYLAASGIRSLRAVDYGGTATVQDLGTPIDPYLFLYDPTGIGFKYAVAVVEPIDGRLWMNIGQTTYVYSYFPGKKIAAWTTYSGTGISYLESCATVLTRTFTRDTGGTIFIYGDLDGVSYSTSDVATVQLPFMSMKDASMYKQITGFDAAVSGTWNVDLLFDPNDLNQKVSIGTVGNMTYSAQNIGAVGYGTHIAPKLVSTGSGAASISSVSLHYLSGEGDTGRRP